MAPVIYAETPVLHRRGSEMDYAFETFCSCTMPSSDLFFSLAPFYIGCCGNSAEKSVCIASALSHQWMVLNN